MRLLKEFVSQGYIDPLISKSVVHYMEKWEKSSLHAILDIHLLTEHEVADVSSRLFKVSRILDLRAHTFEVDVLRRLPFKLASEVEAIALGKDEYNQGNIILVVADPSQTESIEKIKNMLGCQITLGVAERSDILWAINEFYDLKDQVPSLFE